VKSGFIDNLNSSSSLSDRATLELAPAGFCRAPDYSTGPKVRNDSETNDNASRSQPTKVKAVGRFEIQRA
jgi:hypothetical protein